MLFEKYISFKDIEKVLKFLERIVFKFNNLYFFEVMFEVIVLEV